MLPPHSPCSSPPPSLVFLKQNPHPFSISVCLKYQFQSKRNCWEFSGGSVVRTQEFSLPRAWVRSVVRWLRSHKPLDWGLCETTSSPRRYGQLTRHQTGESSAVLWFSHSCVKPAETLTPSCLKLLIQRLIEGKSGMVSWGNWYPQRTIFHSKEWILNWWNFRSSDSLPVKFFLNPYPSPPSH